MIMQPAVILNGAESNKGSKELLNIQHFKHWTSVMVLLSLPVLCHHVKVTVSCYAEQSGGKSQLYSLLWAETSFQNWKWQWMFNHVTQNS